MTIEIEPLAPVIGAVVRGVSLADVPAPETVELIEAALERHGVLLFAGQDITPAQQISFSQVFAQLERTAWVDARLEGYPEIFVVGNPGGTVVSFASRDEAGDLEWHADHMHLEPPARASLLYARQVPPEGGDTLFACMYAAYNALSPAEQAEVEPMVALHSISGLKEYLHEQGEAATADAELSAPADLVVRGPLVRHHPRSGRKSLYFGSQASIGIEGRTRQEAKALFTRLTRLCELPEATYRHRWSVGDALLWDNRRVLHAALYCDLTRYKRELHRTTWREDQPIN